MSERILVEKQDGVAHVQLVRSDKMNALDDAMFNALIETGDALKEDNSLRCVVISGQGKSFCAGLDMSNFAKFADGGPRDSLIHRTHGLSNDFQYPVWVWRELQVPVIAAIHGAAVGGGFQIALAADMRYAAPATKCSVMEIKWGLVPDMGGIQLLRGLTRDDIAKELTYTGRIFEAEEAQKLGLVTAVVDDPVAHALGVARQIASKNPDAIRANKRLFNQMRYQSESEGLMHESVEQENIIGKPNQLEAVMATLENRAAKYQ